MQCRGHMFSLTSYSSILCKWLYIFYGPSSQLLLLHTPPALHWEMKSSASGQAQTTCLNYYMIYFLPLSPFVPRNKLLHRTQLVLTSEHNDKPPQNNMSLGATFCTTTTLYHIVVKIFFWYFWTYLVLASYKKETSWEAYNNAQISTFWKITHKKGFVVLEKWWEAWVVLLIRKAY